MKERETTNPVLIVQLPPELTPDIDPEPDSKILCHYKHDPCSSVRKKMNYSLDFHGTNYVFTGVWVDKCERCGEVYCSPALSDAIQEAMEVRSIQHYYGIIEPSSVNNQLR